MNPFEQQNQLKQLFAQSPVSIAYLTGMLGNRAQFGHFTNLDVAVLLMDQIREEQFLDYRLYFFSELARRLDTETLDVLILNQASLLRKLQVIKNGQLLYSRNEKKRVSFETRALMDYLDFKKFDELQNQALSRRLQGQMLPIEKEFFAEHLHTLENVLHRLQNWQVTRDAFLADEGMQAGIERYLHLAMDTCFYICGALITSFGLRHPEEFSDLPRIIANQNLISAELAEKLSQLAHVRSLFAYQGSKLKPTEIYDSLPQMLAILREFAETLDTKDQDTSN